MGTLRWMHLALVPFVLFLNIPSRIDHFVGVGNDVMGWFLDQSVNTAIPRIMQSTTMLGEESNDKMRLDVVLIMISATLPVTSTTMGRRNPFIFKCVWKKWSTAGTHKSRSHRGPRLWVWDRFDQIPWWSRLIRPFWSVDDPEVENGCPLYVSAAFGQGIETGGIHNIYP